MNDAKEILVQLLGVDASADEQTIRNSAKSFADDLEAYKNSSEAEIAALKNEAEKKCDELAEEKKKADALATEKEELANRANALTAELAELDAERFSDVIENKDEIKQELIKNRKGTIAILTGMANKLGKPVPKQPLFNRASAGQPAAVTGAQDADKAQAARIANRANEIKANLNIPFQAAFEKARKEVEASATN